MPEPLFRLTSRGLLVRLRVQPRASKDGFAGRHGDALKLRLTAPPVDGAANRACLRFLARALGVPKGRLEIVSGHSAREKRVLYRPPGGNADRGQGLSAAAVGRRLEGLL